MKPIGDGNTPWLSIIVPTRGRPEQLRCFIESLEATTLEPAGIEIVIVTDHDDETAEQLPKTTLHLKHQRVPPKLTMGALNRAGYEVAVGDWIFLLNDDVAARTRGWDRRIQGTTRILADGIGLIHVNDGIFGEHLCTFPLVSRKFCDIVGGICRAEYNRYRIDDDIHDIFKLLNDRGYNRVLYLEDILFHHFNRDQADQYHPDPAIQAKDTALYNSFLPRRKASALDLVEHIESAKTNLTRAIERLRWIIRHPRKAIGSTFGVFRAVP